MPGFPNYCDFLVIRDDGSSLRLHPEFKTTKANAYAGEGHASEVALPSSGKGGSSGKGTFQAYQNADVRRKVRFDAKKTNEKAGVKVAVAAPTPILALQDAIVAPSVGDADGEVEFGREGGDGVVRLDVSSCTVAGVTVVP